MCHTIAMGTGKRFSAALAPGDDPGPIVIEACAEADRFAAEAGLEARSRDRLAVVIEELASNALRHGARSGRLRLDLLLAAEADHVAVTIEDDGVAFDPTRARPFAGPDPRTGGGVGLELVRSWASEMHYSRSGLGNRLELKLKPA